MNNNKKVVQFALLLFCSLLAVSIFIHTQQINNRQLKNISIISDLFKTSEPKKKNSVVVQKPIIIDTSTLTINNLDSSITALQHFTLANRLSNFSIDTNKIVIENFVKKLIELKKTKKGKIRIAYLGDSMIEGDLVSQTLRKLLQNFFGGKGVGFVPITSPVAGFRTSVKHTFSSKWKQNNFRNRISAQPLYLSGKSFFSQGESIGMTPMACSSFLLFSPGQ